jgi:hypothetical protein
MRAFQNAVQGKLVEDEKMTRENDALLLEKKEYWWQRLS